MHTEKKITAGGLIPLIVIIIGIILMVYMIIFEDEPGAIPLAMIVGGTIWFFVRKFRSTKNQ